MHRNANRWQLGLRLALAAGGLVVAPPAAAQFGGVVFDAKNFAQNVLQAKRALDAINMQRQQLQAQIAALKKLANPPWRDINLYMAQVDQLMRQGQAIAYSVQNVNAVFQQTFPGGQVLPGTYPAARRLQAQRTIATMRSVLNAASRSAADFPLRNQQLAVMNSRLGSLQGTQQALELNGSIGLYNGQALTALRQQFAALANAQAVYQAYVVNTQAQSDAAVGDFLTRMGTLPPNRPGFSYRMRTTR